MYCDVLAILFTELFGTCCHFAVQYIHLFLSGLALFVILNYFHAEAFLLSLTQIERGLKFKSFQFIKGGRLSLV